jgi:DNA polymerase-3 subunit epsilon
LDSFDWAFAAWNDGSSFTAFDIETTGLDPEKDRIVEFGAVKFDNRGPIGRYSVLINPGMPMPAEALRINHISDEMLAGKPTLREVLPDFLIFIKNTILIAHNDGFDCGFVNESLKQLYAEHPKKAPDPGQEDLFGGENTAADGFSESGASKSAWIPPFPALPNRVVDTLALSRRLFPGRPGYKQQDLAAWLGIDTGKAHRADDDARVCMELFLRMKKCYSNDKEMQ